MVINREIINRVNELIEKYIEVEVRLEFLEEKVVESIDINELIFLAEKGLILAESKSTNHKYIALSIATILAKQSLNHQLHIISNMIFSRIKNFRSQELLIKNTGVNIEDNYSPVEIFKDILGKENNTIQISGKEYLLNDFQLDLYNLVKKKKLLSVSAPTSAGKSFIIKRIIIDLLLSSYNCCVYIVPSRALITEIVNEIRMEINELGKKFNVSSSSDVSNLDMGQKTILVLTQERFYQLCNNKKIIVDFLIIDEAQNVMDGSRGILLEYSIKYAKRIWKNLKIIFISPLVNNPQIFNDKFAEDDNNEYVYMNEPTVRQNIIKLYKDTIGYKVVLNYRVIKEKLKINRSGSIPSNISNVVCKFNNGQNSIVYCNTTKVALDVCNQLYNSSMFEDLNNKELDDFADFIEYSISKNYILSKYIRKGIVYHYGSLPTFIRVGIEELATKGLFKIIACTSTLLQGVNIPAQNIYIYNPSKDEIPLTNLEFWNLAGRAGRMGYDFCGNIILIQNSKWNELDKYDEKYNEVSFMSEECKSTEGLINTLNENEANTIGYDEVKDYVISSTIIDRLTNEPLSNDYKDEKYNQLEAIVDNIIDKFKPPKELLIKLVGLRYDNINKFWLYLSMNDNDIEKFILKHPFSTDSKSFIRTYKKIIRIINEYLMNEHLFADYNFEKLIYVSYNWMTEKNLKNILLYNLRKYELDELDELQLSNIISKEIKSQVKFLNTNVRFRLVKGFYTYEEILKSYLKYSGREEMIEKVIGISSYLELGACRKSTIELISNGLNRDFSIEVINRYKIRENMVLEDIKNINCNNINDNYLRKKISEFVDSI